MEPNKRSFTEVLGGKNSRVSATNFSIDFTLSFFKFEMESFSYWVQKFEFDQGKLLVFMKLYKFWFLLDIFPSNNCNKYFKKISFNKQIYSIKKLSVILGNIISLILLVSQVWPSMETFTKKYNQKSSRRIVWQKQTILYWPHNTDYLTICDI